MYQYGWPDLLAMHMNYGIKWIEMKIPGGKLRQTQVDKFHKWSRFGVKIYVLDGASETDYKKLFGEPNWHLFIRGM